MVELTPAWSIALKDASGSTAVMRGHAKSGTQPSAFRSSVINLAGLIASITGCAPIGITYTYHYTTLEAPTTRPDSLIDNEGAFIFTSGSPNEIIPIVVPCLPDSMLLSSGCGKDVIIDTSIPTVSAIIAAIIADPWCGEFGEPINELCAAYKVIRS